MFSDMEPFTQRKSSDSESSTDDSDEDTIETLAKKEPEPSKVKFEFLKTCIAIESLRIPPDNIKTWRIP